VKFNVYDRVYNVRGYLETVEQKSALTAIRRRELARSARGRKRAHARGAAGKRTR
jgi:hypothetical protein